MQILEWQAFKIGPFQFFFFNLVYYLGGKILSHYENLLFEKGNPISNKNQFRTK